jgi:hypothetical protein
VKDYCDFESWCDVVACVNHHDCNRTEGRGKKATNADGEKVCRFHRQPPLPNNGVYGAWFQSIFVPYPEDVYMLLMEMGLAAKQHDSFNECDNWVLDQSLAAGKWNYRSSGDEFFLASIPLVSAITRSATNVEMCDRHFQVSYLVK